VINVPSGGAEMIDKLTMEDLATTNFDLYLPRLTEKKIAE
jgi:hypothetical protein